MEDQNKKLTPMHFLPDQQKMPWGSVKYLLADLGFIDSVASDGWLAGNPLSDIMQTYLERIVGDSAFEWYGTQFPVLVKELDIKGRTSLHINPDDETAAQRYDAFGKTALWYVKSAGPDARIYLGFKKDVSAEEFFRCCENATVESLLWSIKPKAGDSFLIPPGVVHAAKDLCLLEIAESSELWFRLHDWGSNERELHLEEAFDLIVFRHGVRGIDKDSPEEELLAKTDQFCVNEISLSQALKSHREQDDTFLIYICVKGEAALQESGDNYSLKEGQVLLVPAEVSDFFLIPSAPDTVLLEVRMDPRDEDIPIIEE